MFVKKNIEEHRKTYDKDNLRDFIDIYINSVENPHVQGQQSGKSKLMYYSIGPFCNVYCMVFSFRILTLDIHKL